MEHMVDYTISIRSALEGTLQDEGIEVDSGTINRMIENINIKVEDALDQAIEDEISEMR